MKTKLYGVLLFSLIIVPFAGCKGNDVLNNDIRQKATVGVIETTGYKNKSYIHFYDSDLNFLYKEENDYASLSESWADPICKNRILFSIPKETFENQDEKCIVGYNIDADEYQEYDMDLYSMNELAVSKDYIFGVNTLNTISTISRCTIDQTNEKPIKKNFLMNIFLK